jgi:hypothetical protein
MPPVMLPHHSWIWRRLQVHRRFDFTINGENVIGEFRLVGLPPARKPVGTAKVDPVVKTIFAVQ